MDHFERASVDPTYSLRRLEAQPVGIPIPSPARPSSRSPIHATNPVYCLPASGGRGSHTSEVAVVERFLHGSALGRMFAVCLLIAMAISPFLKGILVGLAIIGAAGAVRTLLGT